MNTRSFDAIIIGGGLAGAGTARALAQRGRSVLVCDSHSHLAAKASGNARGLLMPYVATTSSPPGKLYARGFHFTRDLLRANADTAALYEECGALQLPATKRLSRILTETTPFVQDIPIHRISADEATERAGITIPTPSFFIPHAGYCRPQQITEALIQTSTTSITVWCSHEATSLRVEGSAWRVTFQNGESSLSSVVVLCGAHEITKLTQSSWVPLEPIRGQTAQTHSSPASSPLKTVISYDGYITPAYNGIHFVGAHYRHNDMNESPADEDTSEILSRLYRTLPSISNLTTASSRVCFRASTHDRLPYIGELPLSTTPPLFINAGHGSRGLVTAPMGGEIIARLIHHEPLEDLAEAASITAATRISKRFPESLATQA
jgi:tRNA 5-methylaminomethyl-2-thiouridine biosynthesis bifunctional protein